MAVVDTGGLRKGLTIEMDNELVRITDYQHIKQGRGSAFVRVTMKNLRTGSTTERTFQNGSKFQRRAPGAADDPVPLQGRRTTTTSWTPRPSSSSRSPLTSWGMR